MKTQKIKKVAFELTDVYVRYTLAIGKPCLSQGNANCVWSFLPYIWRSIFRHTNLSALNRGNLTTAPFFTTWSELMV